MDGEWGANFLFFFASVQPSTIKFLNVKNEHVWQWFTRPTIKPI